jgi:hypothetical protein
MRQVISMGFVAALVAVAAWAEDDYEIKVYTAQRAVDSLVVDGELGEASWRAATTVSGFLHYDRPEKSTPQTHVRITYDERNLYFGVLCDEPEMDAVERVPVARDARAVFRGEAIEIFVDPGHSHTEYYQFGISCAASIYDSRVTDRVWSGDVRAGSHLGEASWSVEVVIPWADLGVVPTPGALIGFNVCRDRHVENLQYTNWAQTKANFHDPVRFAHLLLSPEEGALVQLREKLRKGERRGPIRVYTPEGYSGTAYRDLADAAIAGIRESLVELREVATAESSVAARRQLTLLIEAYESRISPFEAALAERATVDASTWSRLELEIATVADDLGDAVWEARLRTLLSRI